MLRLFPSECFYLLCGLLGFHASLLSLREPTTFCLKRGKHRSCSHLVQAAADVRTSWPGASPSKE